MSCCIAIVVDGAVKANYNCKIIIIFFPSMRVDRKIVLSVFVSSSYFLKMIESCGKLIIDFDFFFISKV